MRADHNTRERTAGTQVDNVLTRAAQQARRLARPHVTVGGECGSRHLDSQCYELNTKNTMSRGRPIMQTDIIRGRPVSPRGSPRDEAFANFPAEDHTPRAIQIEGRRFVERRLYLVTTKVPATVARK